MQPRMTQTTTPPEETSSASCKLVALVKVTLKVFDLSVAAAYLASCFMKTSMVPAAKSGIFPVLPNELVLSVVLVKYLSTEPLTLTATLVSSSLAC